MEAGVDIAKARTIGSFDPYPAGFVALTSESGENITAEDGTQLIVEE